MQPDDYAVSAEFYDVLQAHQDEIRVHHLYGRDAGRARLGMLDIGAGTGRVTMMSLMESRVGVHAVEPARAMRAPLMTRLAHLAHRTEGAGYGAPPDARGGGTARSRGRGDLPQHDRLSRTRRTTGSLVEAVARALVPGGSLLLQLPPARLPDKDIMRVFPRQRVGLHEYGGHMLMSADGNRIRTRFDYWVRGAGNALREHIETFWMWPATRAELIGDLEKHGFAPLLRRDDPAVLSMTLSSGNNVLHSRRP